MSNHFDLFMGSKLPSELKRLCEELKLPFTEGMEMTPWSQTTLLNLQCMLATKGDNGLCHNKSAEHVYLGSVLGTRSCEIC